MVARNFRRFSCAALAIAAFLPGMAFCDDAKHPAKPLLWKIEGKGLTTPSYLFGTIHSSAPAVVKLHPVAEKAFGSADVVYTEVALDMETRLAATPHFLRKDGKKLSESLGKELFARFEEELKHVNPALDAAPFETMSTWGTAVTLMSLPDLMLGKPLLDEVLWINAGKAGKRTGALETVEGNAAIFGKMGEEAQRAMLSGIMTHLDRCREEKVDFNSKLRDIYLAGDLESIAAEMNAFFGEMERGENAEHGKRIRKGLLDDRDANMAASALAALGKEPNLSHFFAAGAAHFASETGIGVRLAKDGYTVTRIEE
jgi:uncharacterized protein